MASCPKAECEFEVCAAKMCLLKWGIYIGPMPSFRRGKPMWINIIGDNVFDLIFLENQKIILHNFWKNNCLVIPGSGDSG